MQAGLLSLSLPLPFSLSKIISVGHYKGYPALIFWGELKARQIDIGEYILLKKKKSHLTLCITLLWSLFSHLYHLFKNIAIVLSNEHFSFLLPYHLQLNE